MTSADAAGSNGAGELLDALGQFFSAPIARALLTSTLRRAKLDAGALAPREIPDAIAALERALPTYIADPTRRGECLARLRRLTPVPASPRAASPVPPAPRARGATDAPRSPRPVPAVGAPLSARGPIAARAATASTVIQVATADDVLNACEVGKDLARRIGFPSVVQTKVATAIAELARNIVLYAISGELRIALIDAPRRGIEVLALDEGPGIPDLQLVMGNTYKSKTGMGMGLKGAQRLMDTFEITTSPEGTQILTRKFLT